MEEQDLTHGCSQGRCLTSLPAAAFKHHPEGSEDTKGKKGTPGLREPYLNQRLGFLGTYTSRQGTTQHTKHIRHALTTSGLISQSRYRATNKVWRSLSLWGSQPRIPPQETEGRPARRGRQGARGDAGP